MASGCCEMSPSGPACCSAPMFAAVWQTDSLSAIFCAGCPAFLPDGRFSLFPAAATLAFAFCAQLANAAGADCTPTSSAD
ncbi:hypothetical protein XENTR_v10007325 [Xenopus tropicalis]|nr:hypothetical protein XENTR_v10007325 [Xenopus tropicalis]